MKINTFIFSLFLAFITSICMASTDKRKVEIATGSTYFPAKESLTLVYQTSFGESQTKYIHSADYITSANEADKFKYTQKLQIKDDGIYVLETYQYLRVLLFIKKEGRYSYSKPLLRMPLPLIPGKVWFCESEEYSDNDTNSVTVTGRVLDNEKITVPLGTYNAKAVETIIEGSKGSKNYITEWYAAGVGLIKAKIIITGGGLMGFARDILGFGEIYFELKEIRKN